MADNGETVKDEVKGPRWDQCPPEWREGFTKVEAAKHAGATTIAAHVEPLQPIDVLRPLSAGLAHRVYEEAQNFRPDPATQATHTSFNQST